MNNKIHKILSKQFTHNRRYLQQIGGTDVVQRNFQGECPYTAAIFSHISIFGLALADADSHRIDPFLEFLQVNLLHIKKLMDTQVPMSPINTNICTKAGKSFQKIIDLAKEHGVFIGTDESRASWAAGQLRLMRSLVSCDSEAYHRGIDAMAADFRLMKHFNN